MFLISQEIAENWPATVFVSLRPETYYKSKKLGALSGYNAKAFTISPPRTDLVLKRRLEFAKELTSGQQPLSQLGNSRINLSNLYKIICIFLASIERSSQIVQCVDNISYGNIRQALELVKAFLGSGHVDTEKIINAFEKTGSYYIPIHEFIRATIYGDSIYYSPEKSPISNLFDISSLDPKDHFILPLIIETLATLEESEVESGFYETTKLNEKIQGLGYTPEQIDSAIIRGFKHKLLESASRLISSPESSLPNTIRVTPVGLYHTRYICRTFNYIDAVLVATPILDEQTRDKFLITNNIEGRLSRSEIFREYLDEIWNSSKLPANYFDWPKISRILEKEIELVATKVVR